MVSIDWKAQPEHECRNSIYRRTSGPILAMTAIVGVWVVQSSGATTTLDGWVYDHLFRAKLAFSRPETNVLLVYVDREETSSRTSDTLDRIAANLLKAGVACIGTTFQPNHVSLDLRRMAGPGGNVFIGRETKLDTKDLSHAGTMPMPDGQSLQSGLVGIGTGSHGVYRRHYRWMQADGDNGDIPTLETSIASHLMRRDGTRGHRGYGVEFSGGPGSLPIIEAERILQGQIVPELVEGRVALVGYRPDASSAGVCTPTTRADQRMSLLEFHGHALNTLLENREIQTVGTAGVFAAIVFSAVLSLIVFGRSQLQRSFIFAAMLLALTGVAVLTLLVVYRTWLPILSSMLVQLTVFALVFTDKYRFSAATLNQMLLDLSVMIRRRRWPTDFSATEEPWDQLLILMRQIFHLERLIILELPKSAVHVREVSALNCSFEDINERRRDHRRWPYSAAHEHKAPMLLDDRDHPLFKNARENEQHYLVPLIFGDELFGFLAVGITPEHLATFPDFEGRLKDFAGELGELLYRRQWTMANRTARRRPIRSLISIVRIPEANAYSELVHATHLLERRLVRLENMFESADTASAIYDLFGRLLMVNDRMVQILGDQGEVPAEMTTVDLVATLTGWKLEECRRLLRRVILEKQCESIPIATPNRRSAFILSIRPLELELPLSRVGPDDSHPLQVQGVHCEMIDRTSIVELFGGRRDRHVASLSIPRESLAKLELAETLLDENAKVDQTTEVPAPDSGGVNDGETLGSIDALTMIRHALERHEEYMEIHQIRVDWSGSESASSTDLEGIELDRTIEATLRVALADSRDDSTIRIRFEGDEMVTRIRIENEGFGYESEWMHGVLYGGEETSVDELRYLREAIRMAAAWGGSVEVFTEVGEGTVFRITLPQRVRT